MKEQIREAFSEIHAEEELKAKTFHSVVEKAAQKKRKSSGFFRVVPAIAVLALAMIGAFKVYFTPTIVISMDTNPSVEMEVNRWDRVISAVGINEDGEALIESLSLEHLFYGDAVERILSSETIASLLSQDEYLEIGVIGDGNTQENRVISAMEQVSEKEANVSCYVSSHHELEEAHELGMSCGKYRVYEELISGGSEITPEEAQSMTMHQLRLMAEDACEDAEKRTENSCEGRDVVDSETEIEDPQAESCPSGETQNGHHKEQKHNRNTGNTSP